MVTICIKKCEEQMLDELFDIIYKNYDKKLSILYRKKIN